jgi:hypothetical protein
LLKLYNTLTLPALLYCFEIGPLSRRCKKNNSNRGEIYVKTARYTWTDYKTKTKITKELNITPVLDRIKEKRGDWLQHINRMDCGRLPRILKNNQNVE